MPFGRVYVFYVGYEDKSRLYGTLFHCNILSKHHHHMYWTSNFREFIKKIYENCKYDKKK
jgi:hypothetical protein